MGMSTAGSRDINITPLIDVLLVLLVIFLLIMPAMLRLMPVDLPPSRPDVISEGTSLELKLDADLTVSIDSGPPFPYRELPARLRGPVARVGAVFIDAADAIPWNLLVSTVDTVRGITGAAGGTIAVAIRLRGEPG